MAFASSLPSPPAFGIASKVRCVLLPVSFVTFNLFVNVGTVKASLTQIQMTLEALEFDDWTRKIFSEKMLAVEKCQVLDHLENLQEEWLLRFKFPFPFGNKSVYVTRTFYAPDNSTFHMLLLPISGRSKSTLGQFSLGFTLPLCSHFST